MTLPTHGGQKGATGRFPVQLSAGQLVGKLGAPSAAERDDLVGCRVGIYLTDGADALKFVRVHISCSFAGTGPCRPSQCRFQFTSRLP